jgi:FkbM family methyltransferase
MASPARLARVLLDRRTPTRTRLGLLAAETRRHLRPKPAYAVRLGHADVLLSHDDYAIDRKTLEFIVTDRSYVAEWAVALVLDIGAHKGYFGAYALALGARAVISFEPETSNLEFLERTAASFRAHGADWRVERAAVGAERGEAELHVMQGSWGHSLHPPDSFAQYEVAVQRVRIEAMADVLGEATAVSGGRSPLLVKVNIEGEECATVLGTPPAAWEGVSELLVETHPWGTCDATELAAHLAPAGLTRAESAHPRVLRLRQGGAPRSGPRTAPT